MYQRIFLVGCTRQGILALKNHMDVKAKVHWPRERRVGWGWGLCRTSSLLFNVLVYVPLIVFPFSSPLVRVQRCEQSGLLPTGAEVQVL